MNKALPALGILGLLLGGCANLPGLDGAGAVGQACTSHLSQAQDLQMDLIRDMIKDGRLHAALAHLQTLPAQSLDVRESKATALRRIGSPLAKVEYQGLLDTCKAGEAHHGLGQIALRDGHPLEAERELREAARLQPTDVAIRNDLGVVLLQKGDREGARFEFLTALELDQGKKLPATNLLSLLYLQGESRQAQTLIEKTQLSPDQVAQARARADALQPGRAARSSAADRWAERQSDTPDAAPPAAASSSAPSAPSAPVPVVDTPDAVSSVSVSSQVVRGGNAVRSATPAAARDAALLVKAH
ncbi:MAG: hypothetical protein GAK43_01793 [Stenotrophomonas maltophilia]|nr:MAG: hypothetical protein GAK43_01793 [Stenotrophomonas maltophilia]